MNQLPKQEGWTNYPTRAVKFWMDNDEASQNYWREEAKCFADIEADGVAGYKERAIYGLAKQLKGVHDEAMPELSNVFGDLLGWAWEFVNWREIAEALLDELPVEEEA